MDIVKAQVKRVAIATVGGLVLLLGIITIPYPGPGWLIVFTGLAILATEFAWARDILKFAKHKYYTWQTWLKSQPLAVRIIILLLTGLIVVLTLWLLDVFSLVSNLFGLHIPWLASPLGIFS